MKKLLIAALVCAGHATAQEEHLIEIPPLNPGDRVVLQVASSAETPAPPVESDLPVLRLDNRWHIVILDRMQTYYGRVNEATEGEFFEHLNAWRASGGRAGDRPAWAAIRRAQALWREHGPDARRVDENRLADPAEWSVDGTHPSQVIVFPRGTGGEDWSTFALYCYLELADPVTPGQVLQVQALGKSWTIVSPARSEAIKINQVGYRPGDPIEVFVGAWLPEVGGLEIEAEHAVIGGAEIPLSLRSPADTAFPTGQLLTGENVYHGQLPEGLEPGTYKVLVPGIGESWTFQVGPGVYDRVFHAQMYGLYQQRHGMAIGGDWPRDRAVPGPTVYESRHIPFNRLVRPPRGYVKFDAYAGSTDTTVVHENVWGGWHDAADWDCDSAHFLTILALLRAYEWFPEKFSDGQLTYMPESGNGIPDILDEAIWGLEIWAQSMTTEGGVAGAVETRTHTGPDSDIPYAFSARTRWTSLQFAHAAALLSRLLGERNEAERWRELAERAYSFGSDPANRLIDFDVPSLASRGSGDPYVFTWTEPELAHVPMLLAAEAELFGEIRHPELLRAELFPTPTLANEPHMLMYASVLNTFPPVERQPYLDRWYLNRFGALAEWEMPYGQTWDPERHTGWGWGVSQPGNHAGIAVVLEKLTGGSRYFQAVLRNMNAEFGVNALNLSFTTGLGHRYPVVLQDWYSIREQPSAGIHYPDPRPGIRIYGVTHGTPSHLLRQIWLDKDWDIPRERNLVWDHTKNTAQMEFTVADTMAFPILASARLMDGRHVPEGPVKRRDHPPTVLGIP